jgi:hypothetical protein
MSHLKQHLDCLPHGKRLSGSVWSNDENGRQADGKRRRDGQDRLSLLRIQLARQLFRPLFAGRPRDQVLVLHVRIDQVEVAESIDSQMHLADGNPVQLELHLHLERAVVLEVVAVDNGRGEAEVDLTLARVFDRGDVGAASEKLWAGGRPVVHHREKQHGAIVKDEPPGRRVLAQVRSEGHLAKEFAGPCILGRRRGSHGRGEHVAVGQLQCGDDIVLGQLIKLRHLLDVEQLVHLAAVVGGAHLSAENVLAGLERLGLRMRVLLFEHLKWILRVFFVFKSSLINSHTLSSGSGIHTGGLKSTMVLFIASHLSLEVLSMF